MKVHGKLMLVIPKLTYLADATINTVWVAGYDNRPGFSGVLAKVSYYR